MFFMLFFILRINKNIIKENKNEFVQIPAEDSIHRHINVADAFVSPNGTTTNS